MEARSVRWCLSSPGFSGRRYLAKIINTESILVVVVVSARDEALPFDEYHAFELLG